MGSGQPGESGEMTDRGFSANGPAVQLSAANSIFPFQLAEFWQSRGLETVLVTRDANHELGARHRDTTVVVSTAHRNGFDRILSKAPIRRVLLRMEQLAVAPFRASYHHRTGRPREEGWAPQFVGHLLDAPATARAATSLRPRFVFGHEVTSYGPATAICRGIPRILFPWGGDVFLYAETSPFVRTMVQKSLRSVDLVLPSSTTAAHHIRQRFGVRDDVVHPLSWGIDRAMFQRAGTAVRERLLADLEIPEDHQVILNCRQFSPVWGCFEALDSFLDLARSEPTTHFVLLAGVGVDSHIAEARTRIAEAELGHRFTVLDQRVPLSRVAELMSIADVFTSLMSLGDMRSASVVQAAASGGVPVISDSAEHREMIKEGFSGYLVDSDNPASVVEALRAALDPERAAEVRADNEAFIARNEDRGVQLEKMLHMIENVCDRYIEAARTGPR